MRRLGLRLLPLVALICGCGGGGGDGGQGSTVTPAETPVADRLLPIGDHNSRTLVETALGFAELTVLLANVSVSSAESIASTRENRVEHVCSEASVGSRVDTLTDNDANGRLSARDAVSTTYESCAHLAFHYIETEFTRGRLRYELADLVLSPTGERYFSGRQTTPTDIEVAPSLPPPPIRLGAIDPSRRFAFGGSFRTTFRNLRDGEALSVEMETADRLRVSNDLFEDRVTELALHREMGPYNYTFGFSFRVRSESLEGTFECTGDELVGPGSGTPVDGQLACTGADGSAVRMAMREGAWVISVDRRGDGDPDEIARLYAWPFPRMRNVYGRLGIGVIESAPKYPSLEVERSLSLSVADAVRDDAARKIYIATGNGIAVWNPDTLDIERTVSLMHDPAVLALAPGDRTLYIGYSDAPVVHAMNLNTYGVSPELELAEDRVGRAMFARDIAVVPGQPDTLVVVTEAEVAVYDNGRRRPLTTGSIDRIGFVGGTLYGHQNDSSGFALVELDITEDGLVEGARLDQFLHGFGGDFSSIDSKIVGSLGRVVDFAGRTVLGEMDGGLQTEFGPYRGGVGHGINGVHDAGRGAVHFLREDRLITYDWERFVPTSVHRSPLSDEPVALIGTNRWLLLFSASELAVVDKANIGSFDLNGCDMTAPVELSYFFDSTGRQYKCRLNDALYDSSSHRIYASLPSSVGRIGNSIAVMDPETAMIERFVPVGSEPGAIDMTAGGNGLVVALGARNGVAAFDFSTERVSIHGAFIERWLARPEFASEIAASPFFVDEWLVLTGFHSYVSFFSSGVHLPNTVRIGGTEATVSFAPHDAQVGFGLSRGDFTTFALGPDGASFQQSVTDVIRRSRLLSANGRMYTEAGQRIVPETLEVDLEFDVEGGVLVSVDSAAGHVYFLTYGDRLAVFDDTSGERLTTYRLPNSGPLHPDRKALLADLPGQVLYAYDDVVLMMPKSDILD